MKTLILALCFSFSAIASMGHELDYDLAIKGQRLSAGKVQLKKGETVTLLQKDAFIEISALEKAEGILTTFTVGRISENGERTIVARPMVMTKENVPAKMTMQEESGDESVSLTVRAKQKNL